MNALLVEILLQVFSLCLSEKDSLKKMQCLYISRNRSRCYNICLGVQTIRFSKPLMHLCFISHASCTISHISNLYYEFQNQIVIPSKPFRVILCMFCKFIKSLCFISHVSRTHIAYRTYLAPFKLSLRVSKFHALLPLPSHLEWFHACFVSLLGHYVISRTYFATTCAHLAHVSSFHREIQNQIAISPKPSRVILCMFRKFIRILCFISHAFRTFQTFTQSIKLLPLPSRLECLYTCCLSLLGHYVIFRTYLAHISNFHC